MILIGNVERNLGVKDDLVKLQEDVSALDAEWKEHWQRYQESNQQQQAAFNVSHLKYTKSLYSGSDCNSFCRDFQQPTSSQDCELLLWNAMICLNLLLRASWTEV